MDAKRMLLAIAVLILLGGLKNSWASEAAFTVIPDNEAVQIVGGSGRACNHQIFEEGWFWCDGTWMGYDPIPEEDCSGGMFTYFYERWVCGDAPSGECDDTGYLLGWVYCDCEWYPEYETCSPNNDWTLVYVHACQ